MQRRSHSFQHTATALAAILFVAMHINLVSPASAVADALLPAKPQAAPSQVLCDKTTWAFTVRQYHTPSCPSGWRSAKQGLVLCSRGITDKFPRTYKKACPDGSTTVIVAPGVKCYLAIGTYSCVPSAPSPSTTTTVPSAPSSSSTTTATFCSGKLSKIDDSELTKPFTGGGIVGLSGGKVPRWDDWNSRCRSAEVLSRLQEQFKEGEDKSGEDSLCVPREKSQPFFSPTDTYPDSWFFSELKPMNKATDDGKCQGIKRLIRNCPKATKDNADGIRKGEKMALINSECTYSPDGRLVVENLAPVWIYLERKKDPNTVVQALKHSPGIKVTGLTKSNVETALPEMQVALPMNGCLTQKQNSLCQENKFPFSISIKQQKLISGANRLLGSIYGKNNGLAGIDRGLKLDKVITTFDCVSLAKAVGASQVLEPAKKTFNDSESFKWKDFNKLESWEDIAKELPIGSLISTSSHVTVVVGYLERASGNFFPIVVEAENNLSGVVRAKVEDTTTVGWNGKVMKPLEINKPSSEELASGFYVS